MAIFQVPLNYLNSVIQILENHNINMLFHSPLKVLAVAIKKKKGKRNAFIIPYPSRKKSLKTYIRPKKRVSNDFYMLRQMHSQRNNKKYIYI